MQDPVFEAFLRIATDDAKAIDAASQIMELEPLGYPMLSAKGSPRTYGGSLKQVEHLVREPDGTVAVSAETVRFTLHFPYDYCRSVDPHLQFRVAVIHTPLLHPNCKGGLVCLGSHFRPGTRLRPLAEQIYRIVAAKVFATDNALDHRACSYYLSHLPEVRSLQARPLWRSRITSQVETINENSYQPRKQP